MANSYHAGRISHLSMWIWQLTLGPSRDTDHTNLLWGQAPLLRRLQRRSSGAVWSLWVTFLPLLGSRRWVHIQGDVHGGGLPSTSYHDRHWERKNRHVIVVQWWSDLSRSGESKPWFSYFLNGTLILSLCPIVKIPVSWKNGSFGSSQHERAHKWPCLPPLVEFC